MRKDLYITIGVGILFVVLDIVILFFSTPDKPPLMTWIAIFFGLIGGILIVSSVIRLVLAAKR
jgi:4-amino-4-deoxy-L-arabinose transferase-like glycosyltransferase